MEPRTKGFDPFVQIHTQRQPEESRELYDRDFRSEPQQVHEPSAEFLCVNKGEEEEE